MIYSGIRKFRNLWINKYWFHKNILHFFPVFLIAIVSWSCKSPDLVLDKKGDNLVLMNSKIKIEFNLAKGSFNVFDKTTGKMIIEGASYEMGGTVSTSEALIHSFTSNTVSDSLG